MYTKYFQGVHNSFVRRHIFFLVLNIFYVSCTESANKRCEREYAQLCYMACVVVSVLFLFPFKLLK